MNTIARALPDSLTHSLAHAFDSNRLNDAAPRLRKSAGSALDALIPAVGVAAPLLRRLSWRIVALGVVAGAAGYLIRSMLDTPPGKSGQRRGAAARTTPRAPELNRWENEGGMIATSAPSAQRPTDQQG